MLVVLQSVFMSRRLTTRVVTFDPSSNVPRRCSLTNFLAFFLACSTEPSLWRWRFPSGFHQSLLLQHVLLASSLSGVGAFCCDFTRALFLTYCATKLQCGDVLCLVLLFKWLFCARFCFILTMNTNTVTRSVFNTTAQLTERRSVWDTPKQPPAKKKQTELHRTARVELPYGLSDSCWAATQLAYLRDIDLQTSLRSSEPRPDIQRS